MATVICDWSLCPNYGKPFDTEKGCVWYGWPNMPVDPGTSPDPEPPDTEVINACLKPKTHAPDCECRLLVEAGDDA